MEIIDTTILISNIIWAIPPIVQRKTIYLPVLSMIFLCGPVTDGLIYLHYTAMNSFFMINFSQSEPVFFFLIAELSMDSTNIQLVFTIFTYFSINGFRYIPENKYITIFILLIIPIKFIFPIFRLLGMIIVQIIIMFRILKQTANFTKFENKINIFDFALVFYFLSLILSFLVYQIEAVYYIEYIIGLLVLRIIIAVYFIIVRHDSKYAYINLPDYSAGRT